MTEAGLVLETSAVVAYAEGNFSVGMKIAEVADRRLEIILPAVCLAEAYQQTGKNNSNYLDLLAELGNVTVTPVEHDMCNVLGGWTRIMETMGTAQAAMERRPARHSDHDQPGRDDPPDPGKGVADHRALTPYAWKDLDVGRVTSAFGWPPCVAFHGLTGDTGCQHTDSRLTAGTRITPEVHGTWPSVVPSSSSPTACPWMR